ncbi:hypothetical protein JK358_33945 [Nocardia sp. 2]|uniref:Uncharacterized protein n=1 Tax=Nocardia acididurans TaxID=2802282 RepID=A0ABS1MH79_9NOCA|nr:hypothetical protein [Nocardia acididurans]MBL1079420.1 hypothetical protein [Nocardia acididurans]
MSDNDSRWRIPSGRRVAPIVRLPGQPEMLSNALSLARQPWSLAAACAGVAGGSYLQPRGMRAAHREIIIARTAWNVGGYFPYAAHNPAAALAAFRAGGQQAIQNGPTDSGWRPREAVLLRIVDELQRDFDLSRATRDTAARYFTPRQIVNIAAQVGLYETVTMTFGSLGFIPLRSMWRLVRTGETAGIECMTTEGRRDPRPVRTESGANPERSVPGWALTDPELHATVTSVHPLIALLLPFFTRAAAWVSTLPASDAAAIMRQLDAHFGGAPESGGFVSARTELLRELVAELHTGRFIEDETWGAAKKFFDDRELIDVCALTGAYRAQYLMARAAAPGD